MNNQKQFIVLADHPVLAQITKVVGEIEKIQLIPELKLANYENIKVEERNKNISAYQQMTDMHNKK